MTSKTNANLAAEATIPDALPDGETVLLGIFQRPEGSLALLRDAHGRVTGVGIGDRVGAGVVTAIGDDGLHLTEGGRESRLTIPGG